MLSIHCHFEVHPRPRAGAVVAVFLPCLAVLFTEHVIQLRLRLSCSADKSAVEMYSI